MNSIVSAINFVNVNTFKEVYVALPETTKKNIIGRARKLYFNGELKGFEFSEPPTVKVIESNQIITEEKVERIK